MCLVVSFLVLVCSLWVKAAHPVDPCENPPFTENFSSQTYNENCKDGSTCNGKFQVKIGVAYDDVEQIVAFDFYRVSH